MRPVIIAVTGASGSMGSAVVDALLKEDKIRLRILLHDTKRSRKYAARLKRRAGEKVTVRFGDLSDRNMCRALVHGAAYVLHMAALIPPAADHHIEETMHVNVRGTMHLTDAVKAEGKSVKLIAVSSVAVYGNRDMQHPFGRVGDPLLPSVFDIYAMSKLRAERYVLDQELPNFVILRQTGILHDRLLLNNIRDGLMFHTPWNAPIEWVSAADSARLLASVIREDLRGNTDGFWNRVYNIGGGYDARQTGYETFADGFSLIGGSPEAFFDPAWNMTRNFHCFWFSDSDILEERFHFRTEGCTAFWKGFSGRHPLYALAKLLPAGVIKTLVIRPLLKDENAPASWLKQKSHARVRAAFGSFRKARALPHDWKDVKLVCKEEDYASKKRYQKVFDLNHGYDETKADDELSLSDMREAASFRGGTCISSSMRKGDLYTKLRWRCHDGHEFTASPYTVIKAGHWCSKCFGSGFTWRYDLLAKHVPFYAQVWYDTHERDENLIYGIRDNKACCRKISH